MTSTMVKRLLVSAKYRYQERASKDILSALSHYKNLRPSVETCTLPNGVQRELFVIKGTIPIFYRGTCYNIPISLWLWNDHPESAPFCWVNPTKDMTIKVSEHVDQFGRVYLPYLSDWKSESCDLLGVLQVMIILFGESPPVYSKPKGSNVSSSAGNPPYPTQFSNKYPFSFPAINPPSSSYPAPTTNQSTFSYPSFPMMPTPNYSPSSTSGSSSINTETITKEHIRLSLISAVEDKLKVRSKEMLLQRNAEIDVLKKTSEDLKQGRAKLDHIEEDTNSKLVLLHCCKENIEKRDAELKELVAKMESMKDSLNIDEYFGPIQPLYKQLFNAFVEENSIVDTIFYLNEGLQKGVIDLDVFIKYVRELSRRQFMLRALVKLCREKAGLPA